MKPKIATGMKPLMQKGIPSVPKHGGVTPPSRAKNGANTPTQPMGNRQAGGQYTGGKSQGGAQVVMQKGVPAKDSKPPQGGGAANMGKQGGVAGEKGTRMVGSSGGPSNGGRVSDGPVMHPQSHGSWENLGKPKGGKY